jgi:hypothetical protein
MMSVTEESDSSNGVGLVGDAQTEITSNCGNFSSQRLRKLSDSTVRLVDSSDMSIDSRMWMTALAFLV